MHWNVRQAWFVVIALMVALGQGSPALAERDAPSGRPWTQLLYGERGEIKLAIGRSADRKPLRLKVETVTADDHVIATTVYSHGARNLSIERLYRQDGGFEVRYASGDEVLSVAMEPDLENGGSFVVYTMHDGESLPFKLGHDGRILSGDVRHLREMMESSKLALPLLKHYKKRAALLGGLIPDAGDPFMLRFPDGSCLDECSWGCRLQCAWECSFSWLPMCAICNTACGTGCLIGCAS